jgi:hypothetical protein
MEEATHDMLTDRQLAEVTAELCISSAQETTQKWIDCWGNETNETLDSRIRWISECSRPIVESQLCVTRCPVKKEVLESLSALWSFAPAHRPGWYDGLRRVVDWENLQNQKQPVAGRGTAWSNRYLMPKRERRGRARGTGIHFIAAVESLRLSRSQRTHAIPSFERRYDILRCDERTGGEHPAKASPLVLNRDHASMACLIVRANRADASAWMSCTSGGCKAGWLEMRYVHHCGEEGLCGHALRDTREME